MPSKKKKQIKKKSHLTDVPCLLKDRTLLATLMFDNKDMRLSRREIKILILTVYEGSC